MTTARTPGLSSAAVILVMALILALLASLLLAAPTAPQGVSAQQGSPDLVVTKPGVDISVRPTAPAVAHRRGLLALLGAGLYLNNSRR